MSGVPRNTPENAHFWAENMRVVGEAMPRPIGRAKAVRAFCKDCSGGNRTEVRECPARPCPLHPWRMGRPLRSDELGFDGETP